MDISMLSGSESSERDDKTPEVKKSHSVERKHESELHRQLGIPLKQVQKTSKIIKMQMKINDIAVREEQNLKALAQMVRQDSITPIKLLPALSNT